MARRSDARLWARLAVEFHDAGAVTAEARGRHARRAVAIVRRERSDSSRTFGPGDEIPLDVVRAYDLDGDTWVRLSADPDSTAKDMWRMPAFDPGEHESDAQGCYVTPHPLDKYGPLTEIRARKVSDAC